MAHVSSVDKGLKMKIKRTKGPAKVDPKHEVVKPGEQQTGITPSSGGSQQQQMSTDVSSSASSTGTSGSMPTSTLTSSSLSSSNVSLLQSSSSSTSSNSGLFQQSSSTPSLLTSPTNPSVSTSSQASDSTLKSSISSDTNSDSHWVGPLTKSPLKSWNFGQCSSSAELLSSKDGKSPKFKTAYSKKTTDAKSVKSSLSGYSQNFTGGISSSSGGLNVIPSTSIPSTEAKKLATSGPAGGGLGSIIQPSTSVSSSSNVPPFSSISRTFTSGLSSEPRPGDTVHVKRENPIHDPYEFNAKVEDKIELPPKKLKIDKPDFIETAISPQPSSHHSQQQQLHLPAMQQQQQQHPSQQLPPHQQQQQTSLQTRSVGVETCSTGTVTEPECLGPCEPGSSVRLEGIVWKETDNGLLVVNVTWRGKTYMGTLMDSTRYAWAPPRPGGCESPVSDFEARTPKGRGKRTSRNSAAAIERLPEGRRLRKGRRGTVNSSSSNFTAPPSPAKSEAGTVKRKVRGDTDSCSDKGGKRSRSSSRGGGAESPAPTPTPTADAYIMCPEPNCFKKYKHMNGLRYHRTHAHQKSSAIEDGKEDMECEDEDEDKMDKKDRTPLSERAERMRAKEKQRSKEQKRGSDRDSKDSLDDDIPLKDLANKVSKTIETNGVAKDKVDCLKSLETGSISTIAVNNKIDPHVVLTKTTMHLPSNFPSNTKPKETFDSPSSSSPLSSLSSTATSLSSSSTQSVCASSLTSNVPYIFSPNCDNGPGHPAMSNNSVIANGNSSNNLPVLTTLKSPITSQVYQISPTGCLGGVTLVSAQTNPSLSLVSAQTFPLTTSTSPGSVATCTSTTASIAGMPLTVSERQGKHSLPSSMSGSGAARPLTNARPIAPAPVPGSQGALGSSLKAIQPKPQVSGEYSSNISASLADLNKDKTRKSKKKRSDNKESPSSFKAFVSNGSDVSAREENGPNLNHVITNSPSLPSPGNVDLSAQSRSDAAFQQRIAASPSPDVVSSGASGSLRPSFLPVTPGGADIRNTANDDVHSPAYSDISDANDTGSPPQRDSPEKKELSGGSLTSLKKETQMNGSPHLVPDGGGPPNSLAGHYSGMYYFGGPPGYIPHGLSPQSMASPTLKKDGAGVEESSASKSDTSDKKDTSRSQQQRPCPSPQQMSSSSGGSDLQQKTLINYYAHIHGVSPAAVQYQFNLAAHPPGSLEHFHQALAAQQDPLLRQHLIEQHQKQQRLMQQQDSLNPSVSLGGFDGANSRNTSALSAGVNSGLHLQGGDNPSPLEKSGVISSSGVQFIDNGSEIKRFSTPDNRDQALRDKQNENHQILKENIELKSQMGQHQLFMELHHQQQQQHLNYRLMKQHQEQQQQKPPHQQHQGDITRTQMFQQQKQKMFDNQRSDMRKIPSEMTGSNLPRFSGDLKPEELISSDAIKKEPRPDSRFDAASTGIDTKRFEIKEEPSSIDTKASRPPSQSSGSILPPMPSSLASTPSPSTPVPLITTLPGAPPGFPYSSYYSPPGVFRPMQIDHSHPMYRTLSPHIMGYPAGAPPPGTFLNPSQLGFRLPTDFDSKTLVADGKGGIPSPLSETSLDGKTSSSGAQGLGVRSTTPMHKIHELQEKGRHPSPGVNSPVPHGKSSVIDIGKNAGDTSASTGLSPAQGSQDKGNHIGSSGGNNNNNNGGGSGGGNKDKQREYASSPPTQRHVHTHHHTHVVGGFPPLYPPDAYSAMFGHPAAAAAAAAGIGTPGHPFSPAQAPPTAPKS